MTWMIIFLYQKNFVEFTLSLIPYIKLTLVIMRYSLLWMLLLDNIDRFSLEKQ